MLPCVLHESCLKPFKFYDGNQIQEAVFVQKTFFKYVASFLTIHRQQAYDTSIALGVRGYCTLVTASAKGYKVWVDVRCQEDGCIENLPLCSIYS